MLETPEKSKIKSFTDGTPISNYHSHYKFLDEMKGCKGVNIPHKEENLGEWREYMKQLSKNIDNLTTIINMRSYFDAVMLGTERHKEIIAQHEAMLEKCVKLRKSAKDVVDKLSQPHDELKPVSTKLF